jgi:hypothetical protein
MMPFCWKHPTIRLPKIGVTHGTLTIHRRQRRPKTLGPFLASIADKRSHDFACILVNCKPNPLFILLISDKGPQLVTLDHKRSLVFFLPALAGVSLDIFD